MDLMLPMKSGEEILRELRKKKSTPVIVLSAKNAVYNRIELLRLGADDFICKPFDIDEVVLQDIRIALDEARYCNKLVNDFFDLSVADFNPYTPVMEKINLCEVVCDEILANHLEFDKKGIVPVFEQANDAVWVRADRKLLTRVIQNLISNEIKYATGKVTFSILKNETTTLCISNTTSEFMDTEKIFDKYYRVENSYNHAGTGLGLYICKKFVEEMHGNITAYYKEDTLNIKIDFMSGDES